MKLLLYFAILLAVLLSPVKGTDVGKLIPVEVIAVSEEGGNVTVNTDTGDSGRGKSLGEAFADMKAKAPGVIYLDTAEYLVLEKGTAERNVLTQYLKGNMKVYHGAEGIELEGIADYLSVHPSEVRLRELTQTSQIPMLREENGRYILTEK